MKTYFVLKRTGEIRNRFMKIMRFVLLSMPFLLTLTFILNDAMRFVLKKGQRVTSGATQIKSFTVTGEWCLSFFI